MTDQSLPLDRNEIPAELDRWNWGAFLLNWIWGIGNNTFIALLVFVPVIGLVMPFVLGAKGSRWAWRNGQWDSVEHFRRVQRAWAKWGVILLICALVGMAALFAGVFYALYNSEAYRLGVARLETNAQVTTLLGTPITTGWPTGSIKLDNETGSATLEFSVSGPKGAGSAIVEATRQNRMWSLKSLKFKLDGSDDAIDLLNPTRVEIHGHGWRAVFSTPELSPQLLSAVNLTG
jgi:heme/copper-type cytochrome/quinol oxidase subunit 2